MKKRKMTPEELAYAETSLERLRARQRKLAAEIEGRRGLREPQRRWRRLLGLG